MSASTNTPTPANAPAAKLPAQAVSRWGKLSKHKIAYISLCTSKGVPVAGSPLIEAIMTDGDLSVESQYQSPFENSNPENRLPTLLGAAQSGEAAAALGRIASSQAGAAPELLQKIGSAVASATGLDAVPRAIGAAIESLEGKTNLTKVNSTQVFVSTAPVRMSVTLFFMALADAKKEVEDQISLLQKWALPIELSGTGLAESFIGDGIAGLFPSKAPPFVSLIYSGKTYVPFLIESVGAPIVGPTDINGNRLSLSVTLSLLSRQAWDAQNIKTLYGGS